MENRPKNEAKIETLGMLCRKVKSFDCGTTNCPYFQECEKLNDEYHKLVTEDNGFYTWQSEMPTPYELDAEQKWHLAVELENNGIELNI